MIDEAQTELLVALPIEKVRAFIGRKERCENGNADSQRIFHGRGNTYEGLSFLTIDSFQSAIKVTYFDNPGEGWDKVFISRLAQLLADSSVQVVTIQRRYLPQTPSEVVWGSLPESAFAISQGLKYQIDLVRNQNTGFFLDMVPGHEWLRAEAEGADILNLFSYTCAFSVVARAGGADRIVNIDMNKKALQTGRDNHRLNNQSMQGVEFLPYDIFKSMGKLKKKGPFDIVVCDPPSFQKGSFVADKDYPRIARQFSKLVKPGGKVLICLNAPQIDTQFLHQMMLDNAPEFTFEKRIENSEQFPDSDSERSLKMMLYTFS